MINLGISIKASSNYLRFDKVNNDAGKRISENILPQKILQRQVKAIAEDIKKDIDRNLRQGLKYTGGKVAKLRPSTIKRKGHSRVFLETGKLFNAIQVKKVGTSYYVTVKPNRLEIASYLQNGYSPNKLVPRPFFGTTKKRITELVKKHIKFPKKNKSMSHKLILESTKGVI